MDVKLVYAHSFSIFLCWYLLVENDKGFKGFFFFSLHKSFRVGGLFLDVDGSHERQV